MLKFKHKYNDSKMVENSNSVTTVKKASSLSRGRFNPFVSRKKTLLFLCLAGVVIGGSFFAYLYFRSPPAQNKPADNQTVDQTAADAALEKIQKDPSALPSGKFRPDKEGNFRTDGSSTDNTGTAQ